jgi:RNA polymerase sigma-70 factor (sigma-E family)
VDREFRAFVEARQHALLRSAYLFAGDLHAAEDLLQQALVKLALRWRRESVHDPEAFVRTVLYRDAVSRWRRSQRELLTAEPPVRQEPGAEDAVDSKVMLEQALRRLPPRQRAVLVLRYFEDLGVAQVAQILGVSVGTVKSQTHDALRRLRELAPELAPELVELPRTGGGDHE